MRAILEEAAAALRAGRLVAFPTETVYGLGADARSDAAVARIFEAKGRPADHPLIVHLPSADAAEGWARALTQEARALLAAFAPGPLTVIVQKRDDVPAAVTGGQPTVGLRVPDHPVALGLLEAFGDGVAAPSANRFGSVSPTTAAHVALELGDRVELILDGGACRVGVESTIVDVSRGAPRILRPGGVTREAIEECLGVPVPLAQDPSVRVPGSLASHYAPRAEVRAVARRDVEAEVRAAAGRRVVVLGPEVEGAAHLPLPEEPSAQAARLYAALREVDARGFEVAIVALPEPRGLGLAIADRLRRAAAPRG